MMKKIKWKIWLMVAVLLVSFCTSTWAANREYTPKGGRKAVDSNKVWTVTLSGEYDPSSLSSGVRVYSSDGKRVSVEVKAKDARSFTVAPIGSYRPGNYTLSIANIRGKDGKAMKDQFAMNFTVKGGKPNVAYLIPGNFRACAPVNNPSPVDDLGQPIVPGSTAVDPTTGQAWGTVGVTRDPQGSYDVNVAPPPPPDPVPPQDYDIVGRSNYEKPVSLKCGQNIVPESYFGNRVPEIGTMLYGDNREPVGILTDVVFFQGEFHLNIQCMKEQDPPSNDPDENYWPYSNVTPTDKIQKIDGSQYHAVWVDDGGEVWWTGGMSPSHRCNKPEAIFQMRNIMEVSANIDGFYALDRSGRVHEYQKGKEREVSEIYDAGFSGEIQRISAGQGFVAGLTQDGQIVVLGDDEYGQHGDGKPGGNNGNKPSIVPLTVPVKAVHAGLKTVAAVTTDGDLYMWGRNDRDIIPGAEKKVATPTKVDLPGRVKDAVFDDYGAFALMENGDIYGWSGTSTTFKLPRTPEQLNNIGDHIADIAYKNGHLLALRDDGILLALGSNEFGEIGNGGTDLTFNNKFFVLNMGGHRMKYIGVGSHSSYAIDLNGGMWTWGNNIEGQLGKGTQGSQYKYYRPTAIEN